jgi:hypothetical protein
MGEGEGEGEGVGVGVGRRILFKKEWEKERE